MTWIINEAVVYDVWDKSTNPPQHVGRYDSLKKAKSRLDIHNGD